MNNKIEALKEAVLDQLLAQVRDGIKSVDDEGVETVLPPSPALLKVALDAVKTFHDGTAPQTGELSEKLQRYAAAAGPATRLVPGPRPN